MSSYLKFGAMIVASALVMFGLMYLNTYAWDHVYWSQTRFFMTMIMASGMIAVMLSFMLNMYRNTALNIGIYAFAILLFAAGLYLVRSQTTVRDVAWMEAMIPHHSIAILTSERAEISDPRVRKLADQIIKAQREEIAEMKALIVDLRRAEGHAGDRRKVGPPMAQTAELYRMVMDDHLCPCGHKAEDLLEREGYDVDDHPLRTTPETVAFKGACSTGK